MSRRGAGSEARLEPPRLSRLEWFRFTAASIDVAAPRRATAAAGRGGVPDMPHPIRLQKILSQAGIASRRAAERLIAAGRVAVNGITVTEMGTKADPSLDDVRVDGRRIRTPERRRYILLYKPAGYLTTRADPERRPIVLDLIAGVREYVYPVGRLDYDTEGLLLLTNDGDLAAVLTHPRHGVERIYEALVAGMPDDTALNRLRTGVSLDGRRTRPADVLVLNRPSRSTVRSRSIVGRATPGAPERDGVIRITIREGRHRQVRRMCEAVGHPVRRLKRIGIGPIRDRRLKPGEWRDLRKDEIDALSRAASEGLTSDRRRARS